MCNLLTLWCVLLARVLVAVEPGREFRQLIHRGNANRLGDGCCFFLGVRGCLRNLFKFTYGLNLIKPLEVVVAGN